MLNFRYKSSHLVPSACQCPGHLCSWVRTCRWGRILPPQTLSHLTDRGTFSSRCGSRHLQTCPWRGWRWGGAGVRATWWSTTVAPGGPCETTPGACLPPRALCRQWGCGGSWRPQGAICLVVALAPPSWTTGSSDLGWRVKRAVKNSQRENMRRAKFYSYSPKRGKGLVRRNAPAAKSWGCGFLLGDKGGGGCGWAVMAVSCKSGGLGPMVQASVCSAVSVGLGVLGLPCCLCTF